LPGQELFQYVGDDGQTETISSQDINQYLKGISEYDFTAKDFRTWGGTVRLARTLYESGEPTTENDARKKINKAIKEAASMLCNTTTVCRKYYIHPGVIESYIDGSLFKAVNEAKKSQQYSEFGLDAEETAVVEILRNKSGD
jgi:DNA topoisomerase-1